MRNPTVFRDQARWRLARAGIVSLLLHALVFGAGLPAAPPQRPEPAETPLQATLMPPPEPAPVLLAPEPATPPTTELPQPQLPPSNHPAAAPAAPDNTTTLASRQIAERLFYPPEAIARGLEGEAQVMLFLDEAGNAVAARLERSSGHALLDEAAVRAARTVRALPNGASREVLLPVRFRLR